MSELPGSAESKLARGDLTGGCSCDEHLREAQLIQSSLLPTAGICHESVEIAFRCIPFSEVGGDFADVFRLPDGSVGIYLGDVVGKGSAGGHVRRAGDGNLARDSQDRNGHAHVLDLLNERLVQRPIKGPLLLDLVCSFQPRHARTHLLERRDATAAAGLRNRVAPTRRGGLPSGMFPGSTYERHVVQLSPGDCVLFASDGLHELRNGEGVEFCTIEMEEVWAQCQGKSATESVDFVFERQMAFSDGSAPHDDITAVVLKVLA